jgi:hypothetical protein
MNEELIKHYSINELYKIHIFHNDYKPELVNSVRHELISRGMTLPIKSNIDYSRIYVPEYYCEEEIISNVAESSVNECIVNDDVNSMNLLNNSVFENIDFLNNLSKTHISIDAIYKKNDKKLLIGKDHNNDDTNYSNKEFIKSSFILVLNYLNKGATLDYIKEKLIENGMTNNYTDEFINHILLLEVCNDTVVLLNLGMETEKINEFMFQLGLDNSVFEYVLKLVYNINKVKSVTKTQLLGGFFGLIGVVLYLGNITGSFTTFPFAGFLITGIGIIVVINKQI